MNATRGAQHVRHRGVPKSSITRMQTFIESVGCKLNEIQMRFDDYKASLIDMTLHKMNWNYLMTQNNLVVEKNLKISTTNLRVISVSCYIL